MNDHNLDDLIIGEPEPRGSSSKNILSLIALVVILLISGVFLAKLIFGGTGDTSSETKPAELTGVVAPKTVNTKKIMAKPVEEIPDELKPITRESLPEKSQLSPIPEVKKEAPAREKTETSIRATEKKREKTETPAKKEAEKPAPMPSVAEKKKKSASEKPVKKEEKKKPASQLFKKTAKGKNSYYIQIGSFRRKPDRKYFDKIKAKGYMPVIVKTGDMIKVRVGPYSSYDTAKAKLPEVKEKLGIDGFVVRKK